MLVSYGVSGFVRFCYGNFVVFSMNRSMFVFASFGFIAFASRLKVVV
jgi:hypothetical protein